MGSTKLKWHFNGYQEAMQDILDKFENEGPEAALQWAKDNRNSQPIENPD